MLMISLMGTGLIFSDCDLSFMCMKCASAKTYPELQKVVTGLCVLFITCFYLVFKINATFSLIYCQLMNIAMQLDSNILCQQANF